MYITIAARPLPKCFHFLLSILFFNLSCGIIYVYIVMRKITTSTERFEVIPCYSVALLFFTAGGCSLVSTRTKFRGRKCLIRSNIVLFMVTSVVAGVAMGSTMWLAEMADEFSVCVYNKHSLACLCRYNTTTTSIAPMSNDWYVYNDIVGCHKLDQLSRCMMASLILDAAGAFMCIVGIVNFFMTLRQMKREATNGINSSRDGQTQDWDSWLFSHPSFRQRFAELSRSTSPPTYDETLRREQQAQQVQQGQQQSCTSRSNGVPNEPPPPYPSSSRSSRSSGRHSNSRRVKRYQLPPPMVTLQNRSLSNQT